VLAALKQAMKPRRQTLPPQRARNLGLTLIELAIVLAVLAVLGTLAVPTFSNRLARERLAATAERLAADVSEARFEAARRGQPLYVRAALGSGACWAIATSPGCSCELPQACQVRRMPATASSGVRTVQAQDVRLEPGGTAAAASAAVLESKAGESLRVDVLALGRTRICTAHGPATKYPPC
jgi:type IV fimbrial biogenesis protein FimT